jgi:hypothetical protein
MGIDVKYSNSAGGGNERLQGILGMTPIAGGGIPSGHQGIVPPAGSRISPDVRAALADFVPELSAGVRAVADRK